MILSFSTQLNGKPTYFVEKIHSGLVQNELMNNFNIGLDHNFSLDVLSYCQPKIHTIREDKKDRWKPGTKIDFFINCRQPNMLRFAPVLPVVSVQNININYHEEKVEVWIGKCFLGQHYFNNKLTDQEIIELAHNDGFDTIDEFFNYFDADFKGKLIHWTDLKY